MHSNKPTEVDSMNRLRVQAEDKAKLYRRALELACNGDSDQVAYFVSEASTAIDEERATDGVLACDGAQPVAWLHEFTDPHDGTRRRATWMNLPRDYDLQPSDTVTPLYTAAGVDVGSQDQQGRVAQVIADFADLPWEDCRELSRRIAGVLGNVKEGA